MRSRSGNAGLFGAVGKGDPLESAIPDTGQAHVDKRGKSAQYRPSVPAPHASRAGSCAPSPRISSMTRLVPILPEVIAALDAVAHAGLLDAAHAPAVLIPEKTP